MLALLKDCVGHLSILLGQTGSQDCVGHPSVLLRQSGLRTVWTTAAFCTDRMGLTLYCPASPFSPQAMHSPQSAADRALSAHPDVKGQETKKVASDWAETTSRISTGLSGLTVESWAQCEKFPISGAGDGRRAGDG